MPHSMIKPLLTESVQQRNDAFLCRVLRCFNVAEVVKTFVGRTAGPKLLTRSATNCFVQDHRDATEHADAGRQIPPRTANRRAGFPVQVLYWLSFWVAAIGATTSWAAQPTIGSLGKLIESDQITKAVEEITQYDDSVIRDGLSDVDTALLLAQVARACESAKDDSSAAELYRRATDATKRPACKKLTARQIAMIQLAAGSSLVRVGKTEQAIDTLADALRSKTANQPAELLNVSVLSIPGESDQDVHALTPRQRSSAAQLLMLLASESLTKQKSELAEKAYETALPHVHGKTVATATLGRAWAIATQQGRDQDAVEALTEFIEKHPSHSDVASAADLCIRKLQATGDKAAEEAMMTRLLTRWGRSDAAKNLIRQYTSSPSTKMPGSVKNWLLGQSLPDRLSKLDAPTCAAALSVAIEQQQSDLADQLAAHLATVDQSGQAVSDTLQRLTHSERAADAEQFAAQLLAPSPDSEITPAAREAACRWAGRQQRWSMLALASESSNVDDDEPSRTATVERLFAESLMQVGRAEDAQRWWNHLVDERHADDFATILRCAETATTFADVPTATNRISDAKSASGDSPNRFSLVQMLSAELAVRELKFDQARSILEQVVRSDGAIAALRGRAQWTIGETYYMQEKFADAIEAYRKVEGIDPEGDWVAIALVQAGKSFEQLGRTREAAVCYSTLVSRFADSPHAVSARRRLAAIEPSSNPTTDTFRR